MLAKLHQTPANQNFFLWGIFLPSEMVMGLLAWPSQVPAWETIWTFSFRYRSIFRSATWCGMQQRVVVAEVMRQLCWMGRWEKGSHWGSPQRLMASSASSLLQLHGGVCCLWGCMQDCSCRLFPEGKKRADLLECHYVLCLEVRGRQLITDNLMS